jgi:outer membrane protein OmpA-like peptidoglycan-associated protein
VGYGETQPIQDCSNDNSCGENEKEDCACHQLNRRTEFKVVKVKKEVIEIEDE